MSAFVLSFILFLSLKSPPAPRPPHPRHWAKFQLALWLKPFLLPVAGTCPFANVETTDKPVLLGGQRSSLLGVPNTLVQIWDVH